MNLEILLSAPCALIYRSLAPLHLIFRRERKRERERMENNEPLLPAAEALSLRALRAKLVGSSGDSGIRHERFVSPAR